MNDYSIMDVNDNKITNVCIEDDKLTCLKIDVKHIEYISCLNSNLSLCDTFFNHKWKSNKTVKVDHNTLKLLRYECETMF